MLEIPDTRAAKDTSGFATDLLAAHGSLSYSSELTISDPKLDFLKNNVAAPVYNMILAQPYNALANIPNALLPANLDLPKAPVAQMQPGKFGSGEWFVQNVSAGLSAAVVFGLSAKFTGAAFRRAGLPINDSASLILSGATLEGLRDTQPGESHWGNLASGAVMFSTFEAGNHLARGLTGWRLHGARALVGAGGSMAHALTASALSERKLNTDHLLENLGTGAVMNTALPIFMRRLKAPAEPVTEPKTSGQLKPSLKQTEQALLRVSDQTEQTSPVTTDAGLLTRRRIEQVHVTEGAHEAAPFSSWRDYYERGILYGRQPMQAFDITGMPGTSIIVPATANAGSIAARSVSLLRELPDVRLVSQLRIFDHSHRFEPWLQRENPNARIFGEAEPGGILNLYKPRFDVTTRDTAKHEWNHLLKMESKTQGRLFDRAASLEPLQTASRSKLYSPEETWSVLGEDLLSGDPLRMAASVQLNPIKVAIWSDAFAGRLRTLPPELRGPHHGHYVKLSDYLRATSEPLARVKVTELNTDTSADSQLLADLSRFLRNR